MLQIHEAIKCKYKCPPDRYPKIVFTFNSTRWGVQQRKNWANSRKCIWPQCCLFSLNFAVQLKQEAEPLKHNWFRQCNHYMIHVSSTWVLKIPPALVTSGYFQRWLEQWGPSRERRGWGGWSGRGGRWGQGPSRRCAPFLVGYLQQLFLHEH